MSNRLVAAPAILEISIIFDDLMSSTVFEYQMKQQISDEQILLNVKEQSNSEVRIAKSRNSRKELAKWTLPGFSGKSKVLTSFGRMPIEALRRNDPLKTSSGSYVKVTWIDKVGLDAEFLATYSQAQPIYIPAGSFGGMKPLSDMLLSPAQVVQASSSQLGQGSFRTALSLVGIGTISKKPQNAFTYYLFGCDAPCSVCVDGIWCEILPKSSGSTE